MPLDAAKGSIADSMRSYFRLTGRIPTRVDELIVPTATVQRLDLPPWRAAPIRGSVFTESAAVAAEQSAVAVSLPVASPGQFIVRRVRTMQDTAGAELSVSCILTSVATINATLTNFGATQRHEQMSKGNLSSLISQPTGVEWWIGSDPAQISGFELWRLRVSTGGTSPPVDEWWPQLVIPGGGALCMQARTANRLCRIGVEFDYYPDSTPIA